MIDLKLKDLTSYQIHDILKSMDAIRHHWEVVRNTLDGMIEATDLNHEAAHNAKDVDEILSEIEK